MMARDVAKCIVVTGAALGLGLEIPARADTQAPWTLLMPTSHGLVPVQGFQTNEECRREGAALARSKTPESCAEEACTFVVYYMGEESAVYGR
jgi:hypothetical protein